MKYIETSFIPNHKINLALVDKRITLQMENRLNNLGINLVKSECCKDTYNAISCHPDISVFKLSHNNIIVAPNVFAYYDNILGNLGFNIIKGHTYLENKYPNNVQYNVVILGNYAIHNFNYTDNSILDFIDANNLIKIHVKQGYCKCSICIVDENSIITSDIGIHNEVQKYNIDSLLIEHGHIDLFDLNYGFIGGCSGLISQDDLIFFGDICNHPNYDDIYKFTSNRNKNIICLSKEKLLDLGSLIPLK